MSCGPDQQLCLDESMSAYDAWASLADLYQSSTLGNVFRLTAEFNAMKQQPGQPAIQFVNAVCAAASDIRCLGEDLSDQKVKWQILGNLLPTFDALATTLCYQYRKEPSVCQLYEGSYFA